VSSRLEGRSCRRPTCTVSIGLAHEAVLPDAKCSQPENFAPRASEVSPVDVKSPAMPDVLPPSRRVFLRDTYLFESEANVVGFSFSAVEGDQIRFSMALDETVFHYQGGGQPSDTGCIARSGFPPLSVQSVWLCKTRDVVFHDGVVDRATAEAWQDCVGSQVLCRVDEQNRKLYARLHSSGHLLDAAVTAVGDLGWTPGKGYHFPSGAYVEYVVGTGKKINMSKAVEKEALISSVQSHIDRLVTLGGAVQVTEQDGTRVVKMAGEECPCGGTHVKDVGELVGLKVTKVKNSSGNIRVSYSIA